MIPKKPAPDVIRGGYRFPAFAKPASAGEGRSEKIMLKQSCVGIALATGAFATAAAGDLAEDQRGVGLYAKC